MRAVLICPGRGSYTKDQLGYLHGRGGEALAAADALRMGLGRPSVRALDAAETYSSRLHVAGENASILTSVCGLSDAEDIAAAGKIDVVGVIGNSMGWYTALGVAGGLSVHDALRVVETMGSYQAQNVIGGQFVYPLCDSDWWPLETPELQEALSIPGVYVSIRLGRQMVLGGTDVGLKKAMPLLPPRKMGERDAPFLLPLHSAFHTPLMEESSTRALSELGLAWRAPSVPMVDGQGRVWFPGHTDAEALRRYTLGTQVVEPYNFGLSVRVALRELAPDALVLLGPGSNLGGAVGQALCDEGWAGIRNRADFTRRQAEEPVVIALDRPAQRARVL